MNETRACRIENLKNKQTQILEFYQVKTSPYLLHYISIFSHCEYTTTTIIILLYSSNNPIRLKYRRYANYNTNIVFLFCFLTFLVVVLGSTYRQSYSKFGTILLDGQTLYFSSNYIGTIVELNFVLFFKSSIQEVRS